MTTYVSFLPVPNQPFTFQVVLDGFPFIALVTWNVFRQGWYFNLYDTNSVLILTLALTSGSPYGTDINLVDGYFLISSIVYREPTNTFEISP